MISKIKLKSEFSKNVLTLMTGTIIAQALPIIVTPILTRIYNPEDFGILALFVSITLIFGTIINGRYELAIMLPKSDDDAIGIAALALLISSIFSLLLLLIVVIFNEDIQLLFKNKELNFWLYIAPFTSWMTGLYYILTYLNNRKKLYNDLAKAQIYKSVVMVALQLVIGLIKKGSFGLLLGQVVSYFASIYRLFKNVKSFYDISVWKKKSLLSYLVRYKKFPLYSLPGALLNVISGNIVTLFLPTLFSLSTLGFYSLAQRALGAPSALIGSSISNVFFQHATDEKNKTGKMINAFSSTVKKLIFIAILVFGFAFFIIEDLFAFIFGESWRTAGVYAKIMIPMFGINFIVSAISLTDTIMEKQQYYMYFNIVLFLNAFLLLFYFKITNFDNFLISLSISVSIIYLVYLLVCLKVAKAEW